MTYKKMLVIGNNETGKSNFMDWYIKKMNLPTLIYDPNNEYKYGTKFIPDTPDSRKEFNDFCRQAMKFAAKTKGDFLVVIDESHLVLTSSEQPSSWPWAFRKIWFQGRHVPYNIHLIIATLAASYVPTRIFEQKLELIVFHQDGVNDIKRLNSVSYNMGNAVQELKAYHYVWYRYEDGVSKYTVMKPVEMMR